MTLGILLKGLNTIYFVMPLDFTFEFLPQLIFLLAMFGYMDLLIIIKWLTNYSGHESLAPSIISQTINNFLSFGKINGSALIGTDLVQISLSTTLLMVCVACVPLMLIIKPIALNVHYRAEENRNK